jgi:hypothetical protein
VPDVSSVLAEDSESRELEAWINSNYAKKFIKGINACQAYFESWRWRRAAEVLHTMNQKKGESMSVSTSLTFLSITLIPP